MFVLLWFDDVVESVAVMESSNVAAGRGVRVVVGKHLANHNETNYSSNKMTDNRK